MDDPPTLHEWAGGDAASRRLIDAFYDRVEQDELLSQFFPGGVGEPHRAHVTHWWIEVFGGLPTYTETLGGYEAALAHHRDLAITPEQRLRFTMLMSLAADDASLPDDPEFRAAFMGYVEWGTRLRCTTHSRARQSPSTRPSRGGTGASRRPIGPSDEPQQRLPPITPDPSPARQGSEAVIVASDGVPTAT